MNRPLAWVAGGFALGIFCAAQALDAGLSLRLVAAADIILALMAVGTLYLRRDAVRVRLPGIFLIYFAIGGICFLARAPAPPSDTLSEYIAARPNALITVEGHVLEAPVIRPGMPYARVLLRADRVQHGGSEMPVSGGIALLWNAPATPLHTGDRVRARGLAHARLGTVNFGISSTEDYLRRRGVNTQMRLEGADVARLAANPWSPGHWISRLRHWEAEVLDRAVPEQARGLVEAVWLGERAALDNAQMQRFIHTGTAHILSVSGLHCGLVWLSAEMLLLPLVRSRRRRGLLVLAFVMVFVLVTGARLATLRAAIMIAIYLAAEFFEREPDPPTALSISGLIFLLAQPLHLFDTGFLLSFGSMASIQLFLDPLRRALGLLPRTLGVPLAVGLAAQVLTVPLVAHYFHVLPLLGPLANLLVVPALGLLLWLCIFMVTAGLLLPPFALLFGHATLPLVRFIEIVTQGLSHPAGRFIVASPTLLGGALYLGAALMAAHALRSGGAARRRGILSLALLALAIALWTPWHHEAGVDFLDVGHGDCAFVRTPGGTTLLIDTGDRSEHVDFGARVAAPFLLAQGLTTLDYLVLTHADRDHMGGARHLLETLRVRQVVLGPVPSGRELEEEVLRLCARQGVSVRRVAKGDLLPLAGAACAVLHPPASGAQLEGINNDSLVLRLSFPGCDVLFTGDIEAPAESMLLRLPVAAAILKVPHHGSATSSTEAFLDAVRPSMAICSTAQRPGREATGPGILDRYLARGIRVYRTDRDGGLRLRMRHGLWTVTSARAARQFPIPLRE
jgi:competence protein ComEC